VASSFVPAALALTSVLWFGCTFIVDSNGDQCLTTNDCQAKGARFAGTVCTERRVCEQPPCATNADCAAAIVGEPSICRKDHTCVKLFSEDCKTLLADGAEVLDDNTVWFGTMFPTVGAYASLGIPLRNGVEIARRDFKKINGLPPLGSDKPRRPYAFVACNDGENPERAAKHLVNDLQVPAIIGPAFSGVTIKVATTITIPAGVLTISASATSPFITSLDDHGLVWRTCPPDTVQAVAMAGALSTKIEPDLRAGTTPVLKPTDALRLVVVHKGDAYGSGLADALFQKLVFNGKSAALNDKDGNFKRIDYGDPSDPDNKDPKAKYAVAVESVLAFKPHVTIVVGTTEGVTDIFGPVEQKWPAALAYRSRFLLTDGAQVPELHSIVGANADLRKRVLGTVPGTVGKLYEEFASRYGAEVFTAGTKPDQYAAAAYDAGYLLAYATAAIGTKEITGANLAEGLKKMVPPGVGIDVSPATINDALSALTKGNIDYNGASGPLDFNVATGEAESDIQIWCIDIDTSGKAVGFKNSTAFYNASTKKLEGTVTCP